MAAPAAVLSVLVKGEGVKQLQAQLVGLEQTSRKTHTGLGMVGKVAGLGLAAGLVYAGKSAATFEKQMSSLGAVTDASGKQMEGLRKQAIKAGADTAFSAKEAAQAQTELAKGGLQVATIMRGGLTGALSLAAAGEMELADAASTTANALNLFKLRGRDASHVADVLATAANETTADVADFARALTQGGAAAKAVGFSLDETVVVLEALASAGVKGSDAGTSLKAAFTQLANPTEKSLGLMEKLGLEFFNAKGEIKGVADISAMLNDKLGGMTRQQRLATISTIAGTDGMRALLALMDTGPAKLGKYEQGLAKQGSAAEVAAKKQDNLAGKMEQLSGSAETLAIQVGTHMIPALTAGAEAATTFINGLSDGTGVGGQVAGALSSVTGAIHGVVTGFQQGDTAARTLVGTLAGLTAGFVAFKVITTIAAGVTALKTAFEGLTAAMAKNPAGAIAVALVGVATALGVMSVNTRTASASTRDLTDAMRAQADALRAVRDIDVDVAQRKANVTAANAALAQAEHTLGALRRQGKEGTLAYKQAEAALEQAKVSQRRATRDLGDAEADSQRKREDARVATDKAKRTQQELIAARERDVAEIGRQITKMTGQIEMSKKVGRESRHTAADVEALRAKQQALREEIDRLKSKKVTVSVDFKLNPAPQSPGASGQSRPGDGWGVKSSIQKLAQGAMDSGKLGFGAFGNGSISGSGLNAFNKFATRFGLSIGSGFRPGSITSSGNTSYHALGRARDFPGPPAAMMAFARFMAMSFGSKLKELIYTPLGFSIKNGQRVPPYAQADHYDHVHVAMRKGGKVPGSGTGDRVPALLEPGEFVVRKKIVDRLGPMFFAGMNGMKGGGYVSTSYGPPWGGIQGTGTTATGVNLKDGPKRYGVAVDPSVIPLGSKMKIRPNPFGYGGLFEAFDTGGAIKGNRLDFYDWRGRAAQNRWGRRNVTVTMGGGGPGGPEGGRAKVTPMSPRERFRQSQENATDQSRAAIRNARHGGGRGKYVMGPNGIPVLRGSGSGPQKGGEVVSLAPEPGEPPTFVDALDRDTAMAALTPDTGDDLDVARKREQYWRDRLWDAMQTPDPRDDTEAANNLKSAIDAVSSLEDTINQASQLAAERLALDKELAANQTKILALAGQGPQIVAAVVAAVNGGIGGPTALGFSTPGYPGGGVHY